MFKQILAALIGTLAVACSQNPVAVAPEAPSQEACSGGSVDNDAGLARFAGCRQIEGDLAIRGVSTLEALSGLSSISGRLSITDTELFDLGGLEQLRRVSDLVIAENPKLISIGALNGVASAESVALTGNPRVSGYFGLLRGLEHKPFRVEIEGNRALDSGETAALGHGQPKLVAAR